MLERRDDKDQQGDNKDNFSFILFSQLAVRDACLCKNLRMFSRAHPSGIIIILILIVLQCKIAHNQPMARFKRASSSFPAAACASLSQLSFLRLLSAVNAESLLMLHRKTEGAAKFFLTKKQHETENLIFICVTLFPILVIVTCSIITIDPNNICICVCLYPYIRQIV